MCWEPNTMMFDWKWGVGLCALVTFMVMTIYIKDINEENDLLKDKYTKLELLYDGLEKVSAECSASTKELKAKSEEQTKAALEAVAKAKKDAAEEVRKANDLMIAKPKPPKVTPENAGKFGGTDKDKQLQDYINTHALVNDFVKGKHE